MAACATQTFSGVTQARFECLVEKANAAGISISGNSGQASQNGIAIRWLFDPAAQTLELQCMDSPFFISCGMLNSRIHDLVDSCP